MKRSFNQFIICLILIIVTGITEFLILNRYLPKIDDVNNPTNRTDTNLENLKPNDLQNPQIKLLPLENKIYFGAFPDFNGPEDTVNAQKILNFEALAQRQIAWAYFSNNWYKGIKFPKQEIIEIEKTGAIPFIRLMPRSSTDLLKKEEQFSLDNIISGKFDDALRQWAKDAKEYKKPLLIDFAVEPNGNWFSWSGYFNGKGTLDKYGDPNLPDGPEKWRDAYRHIIDIFREEEVNNVTWFFHFNLESFPNEDWNQPKYYYPGDNYIDWIGFSLYGPLTPNEDIDINQVYFSQILKKHVGDILEISNSKPIAVLEFGITDHHNKIDKAKWINDACDTIINSNLIDIKAVSYWHENWEETNDIFATLRIDSSKKSLTAFKKCINNPKFTDKLIFSNYNYDQNE